MPSLAPIVIVKANKRRRGSERSANPYVAATTGDQIINRPTKAPSPITMNDASPAQAPTSIPSDIPTGTKVKRNVAGVTPGSEKYVPRAPAIAAIALAVATRSHFAVTGFGILEVIMRSAFFHRAASSVSSSASANTHQFGSLKDVHGREPQARMSNYWTAGGVMDDANAMMLSGERVGSPLRVLTSST